MHQGVIELVLLKHKLFRRLALICILFILLYFAIGFIFFHFALNANNSQTRTVGEKQYVPSPSISSDIEQSEREKDRAYLQELEPTQLTMTSDDDLQLKGYIYKQPTETNNWIFAVHGYTGSARQMTRWNRQFYDAGYNIFAPDLRGHGESEGNYYGMGWLDLPDLLQWLDKLITLYPDANITLYGVSMGGSSVLNMAGENLPPQVKNVVSDSAFSSVQSIFETQLHSLLHLPSFPIMNAANTVSKLRIGLDFKAASTVDQAKKISLPVFLIHGKDDTFVPVENVYKLADAIPSEPKVWVVEGANHGDAVKLSPELYKDKVLQFIQSN
jgi:uncharacterized protein